MQKNMAQATQSINVFSARARGSMATVTESTAGMSRSMSMAGAAVATMSIVAVAALAVVAKKSIKSAMDVVESESLFSVSMGNMAQSAREWSNQLQDSLGLNAYQVRENVGLFYNMTTSMGLARDKAYEVSTGITKLAYDMSSFYNQIPDEMFAKLQSGLTGEVEPLKRLGIIVNETTTKLYAYKVGIAKTGATLTEQQKVLARYGAIMEQTKNAQGDLARTITSPANQLRLLQTQLQIASINLGNAFLPLVQMALPILVNFAKSLVSVTNSFAQFMSVLFGTKNAQVQQSQSATDATDAQKKLGDATIKAGQAAKRGTAGFDQLNVLQKEIASNAADATDALSTTPTPTKQDSTASGGIPKGITDSVNSFKTILEPLTKVSLQPLIDSFGKLQLAIQPFTQIVFAGLRWFYDNVLIPFSTWAVQDAIPAFLNLLAGVFSIINPLLEAFKPLALFLWNDFLGPIAEWTGGVIVDTLNLLAVALKSIGDWMSANKPIVEGVGISVGAFFGAWKLTEVLAFIGSSESVVKAFQGIGAAIWACTGAKIADKLETMALTAMYAFDFISSIGKATLAIVSQTVAWGANAIAQGIAKIAIAASSVAQWGLVAATGAWNIACGIGTTLATAFGIAIGILTSPITLVIAAIALLVVGIVLLIKHWDEVKLAAGVAWDGIKNVWENVANWFSSNIINPISNMFKGLWNGVIDGLNWMIGGLNKIHFQMPDMFGGKPFGIHIDTIQHLASGGLAYAPQLAVIGDNMNSSSDPEVVSPLSKLQDIMISAMQSNGNNSNSGGGYPETLILKIGESEFARMAIKSINNLQRQAGVNLLNV